MRFLSLAAVLVAMGCADARASESQSSTPAEPSPPSQSASNQDRVAIASALDVIVAAECHHDRICKSKLHDAECTQEAVERYAAIDANHCPRGVDANALSKCADSIRNGVCSEGAAARAECGPQALCR